MNWVRSLLFLTFTLGAFVPPAQGAERTKAELKALKKVMKSWSKAIGVKCRYCHNPKDFKEWTAQRRIADGMKAIFLEKLEKADGKVHCSDCHAGKVKPDETKLKAFPADKLKVLAPHFTKRATEAPEQEAKDALNRVAKYLQGL